MFLTDMLQSECGPGFGGIRICGAYCMSRPDFDGGLEALLTPAIVEDAAALQAALAASVPGKMLRWTARR